MSRLIKKPIALPENVTVASHDGFAIVRGAKGELRVGIPAGIEVAVEGSAVWVKNAGGDKADPALGTTWSLLQNAMRGVGEGFVKVLEIEGVGYRVTVEGKELVLYLGYALPVRMSIPAGVAIAVEKNVIKVSGIDKELVGRVAAEIRAEKKPEPYKGKGIHYQGEVIRRKVGKKAGATTA